ncbi:ABC transporter permease [Phytoactinopolyspora limicola]|uniref:ABC transporter permease n=1 Tax=Phytoactinopolyspora limicola TaxID=2715536 RepID=UPI001408A4B3|nr:ABC transporter permease [Phytoactinopolyspora limicola]
MRLFTWWLRRALSGAGTLVGVSILIFIAVRAMPGGFAETILGPFATEEQRAELAERYGLDQSVLVQYWNWFTAALSGDFGTSMVSQQPVGAELASRFPVTAQLTVMAILAAAFIGVPLGVLAAVRAGGPGAGGRGAVVGRLAGGLGVSLPEFVLGSIVVYLFSRYALGLSVGGYVPLGDDPVGNLRAMLLPAAVLSVFAISATARTTRDAVLNVLVEPYVTAAVARGETPWAVIRQHILRNAAPPVLVLLTTVSAYLLGGAIIVEYLFNLPGVGSYVVHAVGRRDYAVVQAGVLLAAALFIVLNVVVDLVVGLIDPRLGVTTAGRRT